MLGFYNKMSVEILMVVTYIHIEKLVLNNDNSSDNGPNELVWTCPGHYPGHLLNSPDDLWALTHSGLVEGLDHVLKENLPQNKL